MTRRTVSLGFLVPILLFGLFIGGLMTWHHDTQLYGTGVQQLIGCAESAKVNCNIVNTSSYSEVLGAPIASLALGFYGTLLVLVVLALRGRQGALTLVQVGGVLATLAAIALFVISKTQLHYVCAWCMRSYAVDLAVLVLGLVAGRPERLPGALLVQAGGGFLALMVLAVGGEKVYRTTLTGTGGPTVARAAKEHGADPQGDAPALTFQVQTEEGKDATFHLDPDDAWTGDRDAKVAVVMFGDLECGYCKQSSAELARLEATYGDRVLFVFKHFPLNTACNPGVTHDVHRYACRAAEAAVCAKQQGHFWAFHDLAYKNQHQLGDDSLHAYAVQAGADGATFDACMASPAARQAVRRDAAVGTSLGIHGTPRIFIDGKLYRSGSSAESMARAIETALGASPQEAAQNAASLRETLTPVRPVPADVRPMQDLSMDGLDFDIDTFEASIEGGSAVVGKHRIPALDVTWAEARAACQKAGKDLCTEEQWVSACQGVRAKDDNDNGQFADDMIEGTAYPYGDYHEPHRCWDDMRGADDRPVYTGEMPGCVTPQGVYDMTGNVEEWVGTSPQTAVLLGGAWDTSDDHARCYRRNNTFGPGYKSARTGFRCCAAAAAAAAGP